MAVKRNLQTKTVQDKPKKPAKQKIDFRALTSGELEGKILELRTEITKSRLEIRAGRMRNTRNVFNLRKQLSRALTAQKGHKLV